jgi:hypothetical protein
VLQTPVHGVMTRVRRRPRSRIAGAATGAFPIGIAVAVALTGPNEMSRATTRNRTTGVADRPAVASDPAALVLAVDLAHVAMAPAQGAAMMSTSS